MKHDLGKSLVEKKSRGRLQPRKCISVCPPHFFPGIWSVFSSSCTWLTLEVMKKYERRWSFRYKASRAIDTVLHFGVVPPHTHKAKPPASEHEAACTACRFLTCSVAYKAKPPARNLEAAYHFEYTNKCTQSSGTPGKNVPPRAKILATVLVWTFWLTKSIIE